MTRLVTNNRRALFRGQGGRFVSSGGVFQSDTLTAGIGNFTFKTRERMEEIALEFAEELAQYARDNARWSDRTGDARSGLDSEVVADDRSTVVSLFHTVDYGVWLEIRWNGRYAIIIPAMEKKGSELLRKWEHIMSDIYYP